MIEKALIQLKIKQADGDFSVFMSKRTNSKDVVRVLNYAAKKANSDQRELVNSAEKSPQK